MINTGNICFVYCFIIYICTSIHIINLSSSWMMFSSVFTIGLLWMSFFLTFQLGGNLWNAYQLYKAKQCIGNQNILAASMTQKWGNETMKIYIYKESNTWMVKCPKAEPSTWGRAYSCCSAWVRTQVLGQSKRGTIAGWLHPPPMLLPWLVLASKDRIRINPQPWDSINSSCCCASSAWSIIPWNVCSSRNTRGIV